MIDSLVNEYGIYTPYFFLVILVLIFSRLTIGDFLLKKPSDISFPNWLISIVTKSNFKNGIINLFIGGTLYLLGWYFGVLTLRYLSFISLGVSFAFLSFGFLHYFFPTSKIPTKSSKGKLSIYDTSILILILFYLFVEYAQFYYPTYAEDKVLGRIRVLFYLSGMSFWAILVPLVILTVGRHRLSIISVILLLSFSVFQGYLFLNYLFSDGKMIVEGLVFSFIVSFSIVIFFLENLKFFLNQEDSEKNNFEK